MALPAQQGAEKVPKLCSGLLQGQVVPSYTMLWRDALALEWCQSVLLLVRALMQQRPWMTAWS